MFTKLMYSYRMASDVEPSSVIHKMNAVKQFIREHFTANTEPQEPQIDDSLEECGECGKTVPANQLSVIHRLCPECVKAWTGD